MQKVSFKDSSRADWTTSEVSDTGYPGNDRIKMGCLMRIADATEAMAKNHNSLLQELEWKKQRVQYLEGSNEHLRNSNRALKGQITKLKRQLSQINNHVSHERTT